MKCFARWYEDGNSGACFRDQTILQFGDCWTLRASLVLMNPGSAVPYGDSATKELMEKNLPYFVAPRKSEEYYSFRIDPLMRNVLLSFSECFDGGVVKIYNAFNLKNQHSSDALEEAASHMKHPRMMDAMKDVHFALAPVVFGPGKHTAENPELKAQLLRLIDQVPNGQLFGIEKVGPKQFSARPASRDGALDAYHPSFTFSYGNKTCFRELTARD